MPPKKALSSRAPARGYQPKPSRVSPYLSAPAPDAARGFATGGWNTDSSDSDVSVVPETYYPPPLVDSPPSRILAPESLMDNPVVARTPISTIESPAPPRENYGQSATSAGGSTRKALQDENTDPDPQSSVLSLEGHANYGQSTRSAQTPNRDVLQDANAVVNVAKKTYTAHQPSRLRTVSTPVVGNLSAVSSSVVRTVSNPVVGTSSAAASSSVARSAFNPVVGDSSAAASSSVVVTVSGSVVGNPTVNLPPVGTHRSASTAWHAPTNGPPPPSSVTAVIPSSRYVGDTRRPTVESASTSGHNGILSPATMGIQFGAVDQEKPISQTLCTSPMRDHKVFQQSMHELTHWEDLAWLYTKVRSGEVSTMDLAHDEGEKAYLEAMHMVMVWHRRLGLLAGTLDGKVGMDHHTPSKANGKKRDMVTALREDNNADTHNKRPFRM